MTDLQFLARLRRELATWPDIDKVLGSREDRTLCSNELRVFPVRQGPPQARIDVFHVLIEWETAPADRSP